eukprot:symbB.v1.2.008030.t1/scaffold490.1/size198488/1
MLPPESHHVEANTVYLDSIKDPCWKVGNRLLHFLREKAVSEIRKVNKKKYTVKAKVFCSGLVCEIKVRAYRTETTEMALVVHRLGGDSIAFNALFRLLKQDLTSELSELRSFELEDGHRSHLDVSPDLPDEVENFVDRQSSTVDPAEGFLTPLFDAAHNAEDTQAQAEAAASLASAAEDTSTVKQLCSQKAQKAIVKLLQVNCFEVSCQVVRLIVKLAVTPGAEVFFSGEGLLGLLQRKVKDLPVEKVEKEEEDTQEVLTLESNVRTSCVSSSLESLKKDKKPAEPTVDEEEEELIPDESTLEELIQWAKENNCFLLPTRSARSCQCVFETDCLKFMNKVACTL